MRKPFFSGYLNAWDDKIEVAVHMNEGKPIHGADGLPLLSAKAKDFTLQLDGPRVVFNRIGDITTDILLLDPETCGDTFCPIAPIELADYCEDGDDMGPDFKPAVGMQCCFTYDEVTALIEGLQRVKLRMENARVAKEVVKLEQRREEPEVTQ